MIISSLIAIQGSLTGVPKEEIVRSVESLLDLDLGRRREYQVRELFLTRLTNQIRIQIYIFFPSFF